MKRTIAGAALAALVASMLMTAPALADHRRDHRAEPLHQPVANARHVKRLPKGAIALSVGGLHFHAGLYYRPAAQGYVVVAPPPGTRVARLPDSRVSVVIGGRRYYRLHDTWYRWDVPRRSYVVVADPRPPAPTIASAGDALVVYPAEGQSDDQRARDRYECHTWAVQETGVDGVASAGGAYTRATSACLTARGYVVQ